MGRSIGNMTGRFTRGLWVWDKEFEVTSKTAWNGLWLLVGLLPLRPVEGQEWTRFRGPNGQGISHAQTIPVTWTEKDFNWKVKLPAGGHSSPVVWEDQVFVTSETPEPTGGMLLALDIHTGKVSWQRQYGLTPYRFHRDNSYAAATPAVDANHVYVLWQTRNEMILAAMDHQGREIWRRDLPGVYSQFGPGTSPIVFGDIVVFAHEQWENDKGLQSIWIALERRTGQTRWIRERQNSEISCSTPCVYSPRGGQPQLIFTSKAHGITEVDPGTGSVMWELQSVLPARTISSPVLAEDMVIATCGKGSAGKHLVAVRIVPNGTSTQGELVYTCTKRSAPYVPTPLAKDGLLYTFHDQGDVCCLRADTGKLLWCEKPAGKFYGSPVWVNGLLYCIDRTGNVVVLKAGPTYGLLAINALGEKSHATPAIAGEMMYLRTYSHLICVGGRTK